MLPIHSPDLIEVRATINLPNGLRVGDVVLVDPDDAFVLDCLEAGYLVPIRNE